MKPLTVWSLYDVLKFNASAYTAAVSTLSSVEGLLLHFAKSGPTGEMDETWLRETLNGPINLAKTSFGELPLSNAVRARFGRLLDSVSSASPIDLSNLVSELQFDLVNDLDAHLFLVLESGKRKFYEDDIVAFGADVQSRFPQAGQDIAAASRCFALEEWTACVFHLMRVTEIGLRWLADDVELPASAYDLENWKTIIDQIEKEIRKLEQKKKSKSKNDRVKAISSAAVQFRYFKDAWRNHASHAREHYDDKDAKRVWESVEAFMQALADPAFPVGQQNP